MAISEPTLAVIAAGSAFLGVFLHLTWFIHGEHLIYAPRYFVTAIFGPGLIGTALWYYLAYTPLWAFLSVTTGFLSFYAGLFSSITIYRLYFHPLRHFPGPPGAKFWQFDHVRRVSAKCDGFKYLDALHHQYGDFVRVGPNLLSIADPNWVEPIHNARSKWEKGDWYDGGYPMKTLHQMRDKGMHDKRRKHGWDQAFTTKSLRAYDGRLVKYADTLVDQIRKRSGKAVNGTAWTNYFAYDVMGEFRVCIRMTRLWCADVGTGDMAFGRSFDTLEKGESHFYIDLMHGSARVGGMLGTMPWFLQLFKLMPISWTPMGRMLMYSEQCVDERRVRSSFVRVCPEVLADMTPEIRAQRARCHVPHLQCGRLLQERQIPGTTPPHGRLASPHRGRLRHHGHDTRVHLLPPGEDAFDRGEDPRRARGERHQKWACGRVQCLGAAVLRLP